MKAIRLQSKPDKIYMVSKQGGEAGELFVNLRDAVRARMIYENRYRTPHEVFEAQVQWQPVLGDESVNIGQQARAVRKGKPQ